MSHHVQVGYDRLEAALDALLTLKVPKHMILAAAYGYLCHLTGETDEARRVWQSFEQLEAVEVQLKLREGGAGQ